MPSWAMISTTLFVNLVLVSISTRGVPSENHRSLITWSDRSNSPTRVPFRLSSGIEQRLVRHVRREPLQSP